MTLSMRLPRHGARALFLAATLLLASCGGGDPVVAFRPARVIVFGDEDSVITGEGRKYTVNALVAGSTTGALDCATNPIWVQRLASDFGLVFPQCNPNNLENLGSIIYAAPNATVADLAEQVSQHLALDTFVSRDLVTLMAGRNDVLELYRQYPATGVPELLQAAGDAGRVLAAQVGRISKAGGRVLVSTVPDLGYSPFAIKENTDTGDSTRAAFISQLVAAFNEGLRLGIQDETGDRVALMLTDELVQTMAKFPASYGSMRDVTTAVCDPVKAPTVTLCTTDTLVTDGSAFLWLWADDTHLSPNGHAYLGALASSRVRTNPF